MNNIVAIIQARMGSSRLPGKMLMPILDRPVIAWTYSRISSARNVHRAVVATSDSIEDDPLAKWCETNDIEVFRGDRTDVLDRFHKCAELFKATHIVRVTGDAPFIIPDLIDSVVELYLSDESVDYATNAEPMTFPDGMSIEFFTKDTLEHAWKESDLPSHREHVTPYVRFHPERFKHSVLRSTPDLSHFRLTVDYRNDIEGLNELALILSEHGKLDDFNLRDLIKILEENPSINLKLTSHDRDIWRKDVVNEEASRKLNNE